MKIVCTNIDYCGKVEQLNNTDESLKSATVCSFCGSLALYYSDDYKPIFESKSNSLDIENLLIKIYLKILQKKGNTDDNNK